MADIRDMDVVAVRDCVDIVDKVQVADLGRPTPCAGWTLADLLGHMTVQHYGFAAAARGDGADMRNWEFSPAKEDAVEQYRAASEVVLEAFAQVEESLSFVFDLPEFKIDPPRFPARLAMGFHFIDYVVHAWDVAATLGIPYVLRPELEDAALRVAFAVPNEDNRLAPGSAFIPALDGTEEGSALDRVLRQLGRNPDWRPPTAE